LTDSSQVGCGTGLPSIYILHRLLELETPSENETEIHLQDYNVSVLQLVTLPNLILATMSEESLEPLESNLELTEEVIQDFRDRLQRAKIKLSFSYGDWSGFAETLQDRRDNAYDLVLTAETIYRLDSVPSLIRVLKSAPRQAEREEVDATVPRDVTSALDNLSLQKPWHSQDVVILVAAKVSTTVL
jgi:protein-histidine N-methyltransferase